MRSALTFAKRLGHSVVIAEWSYVGATTEVPADAKTLEQAMGVARLVRDVVELASVRVSA